jgi:hypothetical protein
LREHILSWLSIGSIVALGCGDAVRHDDGSTPEERPELFDHEYRVTALPDAKVEGAAIVWPPTSDTDPWDSGSDDPALRERVYPVDLEWAKLGTDLVHVVRVTADDRLSGNKTLPAAEDLRFEAVDSDKLEILAWGVVRWNEKGQCQDPFSTFDCEYVERSAAAVALRSAHVGTAAFRMLGPNGAVLGEVPLAFEAQGEVVWSNAASPEVALRDGDAMDVDVDPQDELADPTLRAEFFTRDGYPLLTRPSPALSADLATATVDLKVVMRCSSTPTCLASILRSAEGDRTLRFAVTAPHDLANAEIELGTRTTAAFEARGLAYLKSACEFPSAPDEADAALCPELCADLPETAPACATEAAPLEP